MFVTISIEFDQTFQLDQSHLKMSLERKNIDTFIKKRVNIDTLSLCLSLRDRSEVPVISQNTFNMG